MNGKSRLAEITRLVPRLFILGGTKILAAVNRQLPGELIGLVGNKKAGRIIFELAKNRHQFINFLVIFINV